MTRRRGPDSRGGSVGSALRGIARPVLFGLAFLLLGVPTAPGQSQPDEARISLSVRNMDIAEVFEMLACAHKQSIVLSKEVQGQVSVNLYDVEMDWAVHTVAEAGGFAVERRAGSYVILKREEVGQEVPGSNTEIRSFKVQYTDTEAVAGILEKHLSRYGQLTTLPQRNLVVVQDLPEFVRQIERLVGVLDAQPKQILIEAKVLEITLDDSETYGFDWRAIFDVRNGEGSVGTQGFTLPTSPGLFFEVVNDNLEAFLDTLTTRGRVRTLSTPKLLALENQEAEVIVGDRTGYRVTTTINQVTTESIEFLESGVILRVQPWVDGAGRIAMEVHPEVSTASVDPDGIPSKTTTQVTTQLLAESGQTIFIAGLIKDRATQSHLGVPVLGSLPVLGRLFSRTEDFTVNTETVVLITPHIVEDQWWRSFARQDERLKKVAGELNSRSTRIEQAVQKQKRIEEVFGTLPEESSDSPDGMTPIDWR